MIDTHLLKDCCYKCDDSDLDMYDDSVDIYGTVKPIVRKKDVVVWCTKCDVCFKYNQEKLDACFEHAKANQMNLDI